jgi:predicted TIM-barrel fold metal-dependent hydrolase
MGIHAQLLFPNLGTCEFRIDTDEGRRICQRYNDYAIDFTKRSGNRARAVCEINLHDAGWAIAELKRILRLGAKAVTLPCHVPPGGVSPAHEKWDPFWAQLEEANVPGLLHIGNQGLLHCKTPEDMMFPTPAWGEAQALRNNPLMRAGGEEAISPYFMLIVHMAPELWLQTMVMGKVFERFPRLRFGVVELAAEWVGPMAERMDLWANFMGKIGVKYDMKPSEYLRRNVRVTPLWHEDLPKMIERYGLKEVYVFSTDYPHLEGSRDPIGKFRKHMAKIGDPEYERQFFVENGEVLLPD